MLFRSDGHRRQYRTNGLSKHYLNKIKLEYFVIQEGKRDQMSCNQDYVSLL